MKRFIHAACLCLALTRLAVADPLPGYTNLSNITSPPNPIDATNFVNLALFDFSIGRFTLQPWDFSDVLTFTNRSTMFCDNGWLFDTAIPNQFGNPLRMPAIIFNNQNPGQIYASAQFPQANSGLQLISLASSPLLLVNTGILTNTGVLQAGATGLIALSANTMDLRFGTINIESLAQQLTNGGGGTAALGAGVFDRQWGLGTQTNAIDILTDLTLPDPLTPIHTVTNTAGTVISQDYFIPALTAIAITNHISDSNNVVQVIFAADSFGQVSVTPSFESSSGRFAIAVVKWQSVVTNSSGQVFSNNLFLTDNLGTLRAASLRTNSVGLTGKPQLVPTNYTLLRTFSGTTNSNTIPYDPSLFNDAFDTNGNETNIYTALGVDVAPFTAIPDPSVPGSTYSNLPGRIVINANQSLQMDGLTLDAGNFLSLSATNHFTGSVGASLIFPSADILLGSTNGQLSISNIAAPSVPRLEGPIDCYSAIWTNITRLTNVTVTGTNAPVTNGFNVTNAFHVLMVVSSLSPISPVLVERLSLRSTNVVISDTLNVINNFYINAQNLTIASNGPGAPEPFGSLNLETADVVWRTNLPVLQNLTNWGIINTPNSAFFQFRQSPTGPTAGDHSYLSMVNHGTVSANGGTTIWADYFENTGSVFGPASITASLGPLFLRSSTALLGNGSFSAQFGDMSLTSGTLILSNQSLTAAGALTLIATNLLTDGGAPNFWSDGDGFSVRQLPTNGPAINSLRATVIANSCLPNVPSQNVWAGMPSQVLTNSGFNNALPAMSNNAPIGNLILNGQNNSSVFHFAGADSVNPYALYVDRLDLQGGATNRQPVNGVNTFTGLNIDPNVTIYFLDALIGNVDISEKLNGANGGHLIWISNYFGQFSATNVTYSDGQTFQFNHGLAQSLTIDSDGDGLPNGIDPTPFPEPMTPASINLVAALSNSNPMKVVLTWNASAYSTSTVYYQNSPNSAWQVLTNIVQGAADGTLTTQDGVHANRFYRVGVAPLP